MTSSVPSVYMPSRQFTFNSRNATISDATKRSQISVNLGTSAFSIPQTHDCFISIISAEVPQNIPTIDNLSTFNTTVYFYNRFITANPLTQANQGATLSSSVMATVSTDNTVNIPSGGVNATLWVNAPIKFSANMGGLTAGTIYYVAQIVSDTAFKVSTAIGSALGTGGTVQTVTIASVNNTVTVQQVYFTSTLYDIAGLTTSTNYASSATLATSLHSKTLTIINYGTGSVVTNVTSTNNIITFSVSDTGGTSGHGLLINTDSPVLGITNQSYPLIATYASNRTSLIGNVIPYLLPKYLSVTASVPMVYTNQIGKIQVDQSNGNIIYFKNTLNNLFEIKVAETFINQFTLSLLDEYNVPVNLKQSDWSITINFRFQRKDNITKN